MNTDLLTLALIAGAANWAFRALPVLLRTDRLALSGPVERFLAATGPAAIATLFVASVLPLLSSGIAPLVPVLAGIVAVIAGFVASRSVVIATLAGAVVHGGAVWLGV